MSGAEQTLRGSLPSLCSCPSKTVLLGIDKDHQTPGHSFLVLADEGLYRAMVIYLALGVLWVFRTLGMPVLKQRRTFQIQMQISLDDWCLRWALLKASSERQSYRMLWKGSHGELTWRVLFILIPSWRFLRPVQEWIHGSEKSSWKGISMSPIGPGISQVHWITELLSLQGPTELGEILLQLAGIRLA